MTVFQQLLNNNNRILKDIEKFVNCIIEFEDCCVLVTGFDLFAHNQLLTDDCAYGIRPSDISSVPAAKVKHKQNTDKSFTELSIFVGLYELLIVSGYILHNDSISPFLGSSFAKFRFGNTVARNIHVLEADVPTTKTTRLLNQYFKRCSNKPWGYRCYNSQKHRHMNTHHFASYILALITSVNIIKEADAESLWSLVERLPTYEKIAKTISPKPITFDQLMGYFRLLLDVATRMEKHVPSYTLGIYTLSEAKEAALQIMKSGLKEEIKKQHLLIVSKRKAEF
ncbi:hypothetical protein EDC94DRAFT_608634 [Helicostylum pulchrum]|nr:hypothetical protein EDC94DRAFT_608634 [Helicostylum pulchrum]